MSLRIGTLNARFLPLLPSNARRARVLADRILDSRYDLFVLTEAFSRRARRILVDRLADAYPWNVRSIGGSRGMRQNSGLMLLSRLPFEPLPESSRFRSAHVLASQKGTVPDWPHVWFTEYASCSWSDCLAAKGAGYVRLQIEGEPLHVFFTHLQATYAYQGRRRRSLAREIRSLQLGQLADLVREALGGTDDARRNVILLGDLNVDGVRSASDGGTTSSTDGDEWRTMLERLGELVPGGLADTWDRYAPGSDPGFTHSTRRPLARRDYVLLGDCDPSLPLSVQQVTLAYNLAGTDGRTDDHLSDHFGLTVDLNLPQAGCHPRAAHPIDAAKEPVLIRGEIRHPGGLQWYHLPARGIFELDLGCSEGGERGALAVYRATDISRPLAPAGSGAAGGRGTVKRYEVVGETFIRVGRPKSEISGAYTLAIEPVV